MVDKKMTKQQAEIEELLYRARMHEGARKLDDLEYRRKKQELAFMEAHDANNRFYFFDDTITDMNTEVWGRELRADQRRNGKGKVVVNIDSGGGSIYAGFSLMDEVAALQAQGVKYEMRVRGMAASMAGVILQQADERLCGPNSYIMIHRASAFLMGNSANLEDDVNRLRELEARIQKIFIERSGGKLKKSVVEGWWKAKSDIWIDAPEALKLGLIDRIG